MDLLLGHRHVPLLSISFAQLGIFTYTFCGSPAISVRTDALSVPPEILALPFLKCTVIWGNCHKFLYGKIRGLFSINIYGDNTKSFLKIILPSLQSLNLGPVNYISCGNWVKKLGSGHTDLLTDSQFYVDSIDQVTF